MGFKLCNPNNQTGCSQIHLIGSWWLREEANICTHFGVQVGYIIVALKFCRINIHRAFGALISQQNTEEELLLHNAWFLTKVFRLEWKKNVPAFSITLHGSEKHILEHTLLVLSVRRFRLHCRQDHSVYLFGGFSTSCEEEIKSTIPSNLSF